MTKGILIVAISTLILHLLIGWMWGVLGAVLGGWLIGEKGWIVGSIGVAIAWAAIIIYSYLQASYQVAEMARVIGELIGGLPPFTTYALTVLLGGLLGLFGGAVGSSLSALRSARRSTIRSEIISTNQNRTS